MIINSRKLVLSVRAKVSRGAVLAALAAALGGGLLPVPAAHAEAEHATETRSIHDDWTVRCKKDVSPKACEAVQTLQTPDLKGVLAHVAVRAEKGGRVLLIVLVPPGVWLPSNVTFAVAGVPDIVLTYKRCGQYCVASVALTPEMRTALKASSGEGDLRFENGSRNPIVLPVSFKGLGAAMEEALKD